MSAITSMFEAILGPQTELVTELRQPDALGAIPTEIQPFVASPVPLPASGVLMGGVLAAFALRRRLGKQRRP